MTTDTNAISEAYAEQRERDWNSFVTGSGPLGDFWGLWEERSFGWRVPIEFLQPLGLENPDVFQNLEPVLDVLRGMPEVDIVPTDWLHMTWVRVGYLMSTDIMWSQVESFYVNAAPRLRRIEPFTLTLKGLSVADGERIYLGVEDGGTYREARRLAKLGVPKVWEVMKRDPLIDAGGNDSFVPVVDIGYFKGGGDRAKVAAALEPFRDIEVGEIAVTHSKLARLPIQPHSYYEQIDVVAEIPMLGAAHRGGYHN
ncbi:MAG: hypothetical protein M0R75_16945 [Dehalococcoidia bacterium]|nr:hypothetical protein [Dehalococcoidia bacterium]